MTGKLARLKYAAMATALFAVLPMAEAASTLETAKQTGKITVGLANEKPYAYIEVDGKVTGAIIEVLRAALAPLGIKEIEASVSEFSALVPGVMASRFDIIGAGMYVTPKRCQSIAFTNPLTQIATVLAAPAGNPNKIHSLEDIAVSSTLKIGSQVGTAQVEDLHRAGIPDDRIALFSRDIEAMAGLRAGRVDAIYYPALELSELIAKSGGSEVERVEPFAIAKGADGKPLLNYQSLGFRKDDTDFIAALNEQLAGLRSSGKLTEILKPFGFTEHDLPDLSVTAEKVCAGS